MQLYLVTPTQLTICSTAIPIVANLLERFAIISRKVRSTKRNSENVLLRERKREREGERERATTKLLITQLDYQCMCFDEDAAAVSRRSTNYQGDSHAQMSSERFRQKSDRVRQTTGKNDPCCVLSEPFASSVEERQQRIERKATGCSFPCGCLNKCIQPSSLVAGYWGTCKLWYGEHGTSRSAHDACD